MFNVEKKLREAQFFLEKVREREGWHSATQRCSTSF